jgi:hypothetical protein
MPDLRRGTIHATTNLLLLDVQSRHGAALVAYSHDGSAASWTPEVRESFPRVGAMRLPLAPFANDLGAHENFIAGVHRWLEGDLRVVAARKLNALAEFANSDPHAAALLNELWASNSCAPQIAILLGGARIGDTRQDRAGVLQLRPFAFDPFAVDAPEQRDLDRAGAMREFELATREISEATRIPSPVLRAMTREDIELIDPGLVEIRALVAADTGFVHFCSLPGFTVVLGDAALKNPRFRRNAIALGLDTGGAQLLGRTRSGDAAVFRVWGGIDFVVTQQCRGLWRWIVSQPAFSVVATASADAGLVLVLEAPQPGANVLVLSEANLADSVECPGRYATTDHFAHDGFDVELLAEQAVCVGSFRGRLQLQPDPPPPAEPEVEIEDEIEIEEDEPEQETQHERGEEEEDLAEKEQGEEEPAQFDFSPHESANPRVLRGGRAAAQKVRACGLSALLQFYPLLPIIRRLARGSPVFEAAAVMMHAAALTGGVMPTSAEIARQAGVRTMNTGAIAIAAVVRCGLNVVPAGRVLLPERRLGATVLAQRRAIAKTLFEDADADLGLWRYQIATLDKNLRLVVDREGLLTIGAAYIAAGILHQPRGEGALSRRLAKLFPGTSGFDPTSVGRALRALRGHHAISDA